MSEKLLYMRSYALDGGINNNTADIAIGPQSIDSMSLSNNSKNISYGRRFGITSRYGIMPVPGHCTQEIVSTIGYGENTNQKIYGLAGLELVQATAANGSVPMDNNVVIFGAIIVNVRMDNSIVSSQIFLPTGDILCPVVYWICGRLVSGSTYEICLVPSINYSGTVSNPEVLSSYLEGGAGFGGSRASVTFGGTTEIDKTFKAIDRLHTSDLLNFKQYDASADSSNTVISHAPFAQIKARIQTNIREFIGVQTNAAIDAFQGGDPGATPRSIAFGYYCTPYWLSKKITDNSSIGLTLSLSSDGVNYLLAVQKTWNIITKFGPASTTTISGGLNKNRSVAVDGVNSFGGFLKYGTSLVWSNNGQPYTNDALTYFGRVENRPNTSDAEMFAICLNGKPKIVLFNNDLRDSTYNGTVRGNYSAVFRSGHGNDLQQWIDPTETFWKPRMYQTTDVSLPSGTTRYTEATAAAPQPLEKQTCFRRAPLFKVGTDTENISNAGFLTLQTTYEISYSIYNAITGKESNVGVPIKVFHGTPYTSPHNYVIHRSAGRPYAFGASAPDVGNTHSYLPNLPDMFPDLDSSAIIKMPLNLIYYRIYYRELGSFEWLFAGEHSFAKVYFEINSEEVTVGSSTPIGPVGGQPGGFNDYSDLPKDTYIDVKGFGDRLFWLTKGSLRYSMRTDKLSYPARNFYPCADGEFKGMIEHYFAGQSKQSGRLVVFGTEGIYDGSFTGDLKYAQVRVSATSQPQNVQLDGSDFELSRRGSDTAFSGRSACVAEGVLFFMGPTGIFADSGVDLPTKISQQLEPDYFTSYNKTRTKEFHAYFNKKCREILFFYVPESTSDGYKMKAWVFSLRTQTFTQYFYRNEIPWAQNLNWTDFVRQGNLGGYRTLIGQRTGTAGKTRVFFHDDDCNGGDSQPGYEFLVKALTKIGGNQIRLDIAAGFLGNTAVIPIGTPVGIKDTTNWIGYSGSQNLDGLYSVKAVGTSPANSITIEVPTATYAALSSVSFIPSQQFPLYVGTDPSITPSISSSAIESTIETQYLCPISMDLWSSFRYAHLLINPTDAQSGDLIPTVALQWRMNHEIGGFSDTKNLPLTKLQSGETTTQLYVDLLNSNMTTTGQAIKYKFTYNQLYQRYTLFTFTTRYQDKGEGEIKYYQRDNA